MAPVASRACGGDDAQVEGRGEGAILPLLVENLPVVLCLCENGNDVEQRVAFSNQHRRVQVRAGSDVSRMNVLHAKSKSDAKRKGDGRGDIGERKESVERRAGRIKNRL